jgi:hypothetical protein
VSASATVVDPRRAAIPAAGDNKVANGVCLLGAGYGLAGMEPSLDNYSLCMEILSQLTLFYNFDHLSYPKNYANNIYIVC